MRIIAVLACFALIAIGLAGCTEKSEKKDDEAKSLGGARPTKAVNRTGIEQRLGRNIATTGQEKAGDWYVLSASAAPAGNLTAFQFNIPEGALAQTGGSSRLLSMEVVPVIVGTPDNILEWTFVPFIVDQGRTRLFQYQDVPFSGGVTFGSLRGRSFVVETPLKVANVALPTPSQSEVPISLAPRVVAYGDSQLREPGVVYFVVGAKAKQATEFGIALRMLDHRPGPQERGPENLEAFLADVGRAIPFGIKRVGLGTGFVFAQYDSTVGVKVPPDPAQPVTHTDVKSEGVKVDDRQSVRQVPTVTVRDTTVSSGLEGAEGWTFVSVAYSSTCGTGKWAAKIEAHGKTFAPRSLVAQHAICGALYGAIPGGVVFGIPRFTFSGDGVGPAKVSFEIQVVSQGLETFNYLHLSLGASLSTLLNRPALPIAQALTGVAGNVPPGADMKDTA